MDWWWHRIWKEEKLGRMGRYRKMRTGETVPLSAERPNHVWCVDIVFDACLDGAKLKIQAVKDEFTKECLALEAATSIKGPKERSILTSLFADRGEPKYLPSDNGPEFVAHSLTVWLAFSGTASGFIKPGSPCQNGRIESFNGKLRAEFLNVEVFHNLADVQVKLAGYRRWYNQDRPHSSLGYLTPETCRRIYLDSKNKEEPYS